MLHGPQKESVHGPLGRTGGIASKEDALQRSTSNQSHMQCNILYTLPVQSGYTFLLDFVPIRSSSGLREVGLFLRLK